MAYVIYHSNVSMFLIAKHTEHFLRDWAQYGIQKAMEGFTNIFRVFLFGFFFSFFLLAFKHH